MLLLHTECHKAVHSTKTGNTAKMLLERRFPKIVLNKKEKSVAPWDLIP
jgi:hypothetical protein